MDENRELALLQELSKNSRRQVRLAGMQCIFTFITAVIFGGILVLLYHWLPQMADMLIRLDSVLTDLEQLTKQLGNMDLEGMVEGIHTLVATGQLTLEQTAGKLETIDLETLNRAIGDLADVVEPLARFFNTFK